MRNYPTPPPPNMIAIIQWVRDITVLRNEDVSEIRNLNNRLVAGRLRTDRTTPSAHDDVIDGIDKEGDIVRTGTYEYIIVNDSGTLVWARSAVDAVW